MSASQDRLRARLHAARPSDARLTREAGLAGQAGYETARRERLRQILEAEETKVRDEILDHLRAVGWSFHPPGQTCPIAHPRARSTDPATSAAAAVRALPTARTHAARLLERYAVEDRTRQEGFRVGYNADEVALAAGLSGAWRRVSELAALDLIEPAPVPGDPPPPAAPPLTRPGRSGAQQTVYRITEKGRRHVASLFPGD